MYTQHYMAEVKIALWYVRERDSMAGQQGLFPYSSHFTNGLGRLQRTDAGEGKGISPLVQE